MPRQPRAIGEITPRQTEIALLYCAGFARAYIASSLRIERDTVDASIARTYMDLGINRKARLRQIMTKRLEASA
jgi:DNA-binding NarL/FixJ family response regulator